MDITKLLCELSNACGVTGESGALDVAQSCLDDLGEVKRDIAGGLTCTFGEGERTLMLDAHSDEIGFIVTAIDGDFLRVAAVGGIDTRVLADAEVTVHGKENLFGVFSSIPPHLKKDADKAPEIDVMTVDCGLPKEELERLVTLGERVSFNCEAAPMLGSRITGKSLDNRAGVAAVILAAHAIDRLKCPFKVIVSLSAQEELSLRGARTATYSAAPDEAIVVDVSFGDGPDVPKSMCGKVSAGAMLGFSPVLSRAMTKRLATLADEENIPYQSEVMSGSTGTNADVISISRSGVSTALISIPLRNMHTNAEVVDTSDIEATARLIAAYANNGGAFDA